MKPSFSQSLYSLFLLSFIPFLLGAAPMPRAEDAMAQVSQHMQAGLAAYEGGAWKESARQFRNVVDRYPRHTQALDACFYLGASYYEAGDYELAHQYLDKYLASGHTAHFEKALEYDFGVAEAYRGGSKRHLFGLAAFPCWLPAKKEAKEIYQAIVSSYPGHEVAAYAHRSLAQLEVSSRNYQEAVASLQTLIQRFPHHELCLEAHRDISNIYLKQQRAEYRNPDLLELAKINLDDFDRRFPRHEGREDLISALAAMREIYAEGMYSTGQFYERTEKPKASVLYYMAAMREFPETGIAKDCQARLEVLSPAVQELRIPEEYLICEEVPQG